jgi:lysophospholipase L1-like esterase
MDVGADATIGVAGAQNNTTYYGGDGVHFTAAGNTVIAGLAYDVVSAL